MQQFWIFLKEKEHGSSVLKTGDIFKETGNVTLVVDDL